MSRLNAPAAERNRIPILEVLRRFVPEDAFVLEVASGSGQHAAYFAAELPGTTWQPSDADPRSFGSIRAWGEHEGATNLRAPLELHHRGCMADRRVRRGLQRQPGPHRAVGSVSRSAARCGPAPRR